MVDEGDIINKPTHYISLFKGYEQLVALHGQTKKQVYKKLKDWFKKSKENFVITTLI
jgi:hypothetical protein